MGGTRHNRGARFPRRECNFYAEVEGACHVGEGSSGEEQEVRLGMIEDIYIRCADGM